MSERLDRVEAGLDSVRAELRRIAQMQESAQFPPSIAESVVGTYALSGSRLGGSLRFVFHTHYYQPTNTTSQVVNNTSCL